MTLKEYWAGKGTIRDLANHLGLPATTPIRTVQRYIEHERLPNIGLIRRIAVRTDGAVGFEDWPDRAERMPKRARVTAGHAEPVAARQSRTNAPRLARAVRKRELAEVVA